MKEKVIEDKLIEKRIGFYASLKYYYLSAFGILKIQRYGGVEKILGIDSKIIKRMVAYDGHDIFYKSDAISLMDIIAIPFKLFHALFLTILGYGIGIPVIAIISLVEILSKIKLKKIK